VIQADPVISAQLLKISNSVLFASANRKIQSVKDAIIRVGFKETRRLVMSMSVMQLFGEKSNSAGLDRKAFWFHSLVCGVISERLARQMEAVSTEEAFLAGILHDFGILLLDEYFPTIFSRVLDDTTDKNSGFILCENAILGFTHNEMIGELFSRWKFPDTVAEAILGQSRFREFQNSIDTPGRKIALCIGLSEILAKTIGLGKECDRFITPIENWVFNSVRMPAGVTDAFIEDVAHQISLYREFLKLDGKEFSMIAQDKPCAGAMQIGVVNLTKDIFIPPFLYFKSEGYTIVPLSLDSSNGDTGSVHEVIVWAGERATDEIVAQAVSLVQGHKGQPLTPRNGNRPLVVVFSQERPPAALKGDDRADVRFFNTSFDARQLDIQA
jgi:hypothetical protein